LKAPGFNPGAYEAKTRFQSFAFKCHYCRYNKEHVHMNSTKWTTLTEFIKMLGREGICEIDETPKGWFLIYRPEVGGCTSRIQLTHKLESAWFSTPEPMQ
jgi:hypothetical protein